MKTVFLESETQLRDCVVQSGAGGLCLHRPASNTFSGKSQMWMSRWPQAEFQSSPGDSLSFSENVTSISGMRDAAQKRSSFSAPQINFPLLLDWETTEKRHGKALEMGLCPFIRDFQL